jgi:hypothetical protein
MTKVVNGILYFQHTPDAKCELCGATAELRPYGPNGENICFECGQKNPEETLKQFDKLLDQVKTINPNNN